MYTSMKLPPKLRLLNISIIPKFFFVINQSLSSTLAPIYFLFSLLTFKFLSSRNSCTAWNHTIYTLLCLTSFDKHNVFKIHLCCCWYHSNSLLDLSVCLYIHLLMDIWVDSSFELWRIKVLWLFPCKLLYRHIISLGKIFRSGIPVSNAKFMFSFLRSCHIVFQSGCTILLSHQLCACVCVCVYF